MKLTKKTKFSALAIVFAIQLLAASYVLFDAWHTRSTGREIVVESVPVDPRSLFRGNYARINYDFSRAHPSVMPLPVHPGERIFVVLRADADGLYRFVEFTLSAPTIKPDEIFLKGRVEHGCRRSSHHVDSWIPFCRLRFGIEAFFATRDEALSLERELRETGARAVLRVTTSGKAALIDIIPAQKS